jgi:phosphatidylglycerol:prolipoprotein diacylglycerol transferase
MHSLAGTQPHLILELCAYFVGARLYWRAARGQPLPALRADRILLLAGAVFGAALGSKLLHVLEHVPALLISNDRDLWLGGKSVVGGFIGGTLGVELAKRAVGWDGATGDPWVPALAAGLVIGRVGCQLSGTWDQTYGSSTDLPWAWDYGDGIGRHPTGIYEIILVTLLFFAIWYQPRLSRRPGARFAAFLAGYCVMRFCIDFLKPPFSPIALNTLPVGLYAGLSPIQWACMAGSMGYLLLLRYRLSPANGQLVASRQ